MTAPHSTSIGALVSPSSHCRCGTTDVRGTFPFASGYWRARAAATASSRSCARSNESPGARRATVRSMRAPRCSVIGCTVGDEASRAKVVQISTRRVPMGNANPGGATPTTTCGWLSRVTTRPTTAGSPPNCDRHSPSPMMTTRAAGCSSAGTKLRPMAGLTPSTSRRFQETISPFRTRGPSCPTSVNCSSR